MAQTPSRYRPNDEPQAPSCEPADAAAIQALHRGSASTEQQKRALTWIIEKGAATYATSYRKGGPEGDRETVFAEGRRFVGNLIVGVLKLKLGQPRREQP